MQRPFVEQICSISVGVLVVGIKLEWQVTWMPRLRLSGRWCICIFSINTIDIRSTEVWPGLSLGNICQKYYRRLRHGLRQTGQDANEEGIVERNLRASHMIKTECWINRLLPLLCSVSNLGILIFIRFMLMKVYFSWLSWYRLGSVLSAINK